MVAEVNAEENYEFSDLLTREPTGKIRRGLINELEVNDYHSVINFHGNRDEALEFISAVKRNIDFKDSVTVNFDKSASFESAYIDDEILNLKVEDINFERDMKYIIDTFGLEFYKISIEDCRRKILFSFGGKYTITAKEQAVNKEDVEFLVKLACQKREYGLFGTEPASQILKFPVENKTMQIVEFSPYLFHVNFSSEDKNGVESAFREQVENILKNIPNLDYTVEIDEPYLDENRYRVENYLKINEAGNVLIYGIPKELGKSKKADRTFREMKKALQKHYNDGKEIFTVLPEFALKLFETSQNDIEVFDEDNEGQILVTVTYDKCGYNKIRKFANGNIFMESPEDSLKMLWKDFKQYSNCTTNALEVSERDSIYSISSCRIISFNSFYIVHSDKIANYDVLDFSCENNLKLLVTSDGDFFPYSFKNDETWALIENGNIKIAMSKENFNDLIEMKGGKKEAIDYLKKSTGLKETEKRFKNIEIQIYNNVNHWNDNFFNEKEIAEKIILKQEKN